MAEWTFADTLGIAIHIFIVISIIQFYLEYERIRKYCLQIETSKEKTNWGLIFIVAFFVGSFFYHRSIYAYKFFRY